MLLYNLVKNGNMQFNSPRWGIVEILSVAELGHCTLSGHCWLGLGITGRIATLRLHISEQRGVPEP